MLSCPMVVGAAGGKVNEIFGGDGRRNLTQRTRRKERKEGMGLHMEMVNDSLRVGPFSISVGR